MKTLPKTARLVAAGALLLVTMANSATAQSLAVLPVTVQMAPGQMATLLTVINQGPTETAIQVRAFGWTQADGTDQLIASEDIVASPPLAKIAPGATQIVRVVLRQPVTGTEGAYRILLDQIPPPAEPGVVRVAIRMSLPVFAEPETRVVPHLQFHIEHQGGQAYLVALNDGGRHETVRNIVLVGDTGKSLTIDKNESPYVLAGATRRWPISTLGAASVVSGAVRLTATTDSAPLTRRVLVVERP